MLTWLIHDRRFAYVDLSLVLLGGMIGMYEPKIGFWCIPIILLPWLLRFSTGSLKHKPISFGWLILIFFITAVTACFSAYDRPLAFQKLYFIGIAILLYYSLIHQPEENLETISWIFWGIGVAISLYFFITHDFIKNPRDIAFINQLGVRWMSIRPQLGWMPIPSGHVPGLSVLTASFVLYRFTRPNKSKQTVSDSLVWIGFIIILLAILITTSSSIWVALISVVGIWLIWLFLQYTGLTESENTFPWLALLFLVIMVASLYLVGASPSSNPGNFGINNRLEVFSRSLYLLGDFPIWGGGLASFSGLYSQYILNIPYHYFEDSYNLFLDIMIEQGLGGGWALLAIYLIGVFRTARSFQNANSRLNGFVLSVLVFTIVHGSMQDYLYTPPGIILLLFPPALVGLFALPAQPKKRVATFSTRPRVIAIILLPVFLLILGLHNRSRLGSIWYSNLGSVQLSREQLKGFPEVGWVGIKIAPQLQPAEEALLTSLQLDPQNLTANYRLGLIYMIRQEFDKAVEYLALAYQLAPSHRGILKSLGYCYLWLGDLDTAQGIFIQFPEVRNELEAYQSWWQNQDRADLVQKTNIMLGRMDAVLSQP